MSSISIPWGIIRLPLGHLATIIDLLRKQYVMLNIALGIDVLSRNSQKQEQLKIKFSDNDQQLTS